MSTPRIVVVVLLMANIAVAQYSATPKSDSYFTVDANSEKTSTKNWWGENVDNGIEQTTTPPLGTSNDAQVSTDANVQNAGVLPESGTISGAPNSSIPINAKDSGNSTSSTDRVAIASSAFVVMAYAVLN